MPRPSFSDRWAWCIPAVMPCLPAVALAPILLALGCTRGNPLFDAVTNTDGDGGTSVATGSGTTDPNPGTVTTPTTGDTSGGATASSTNPVDSTGPGGSTTGSDTSVGDTSAGASTTTGGDTTTTTGDSTTGGDPGDGLLDPGEHSLVAAAHCVGIDKKLFAVTLSAAECGQLILDEESTSQKANACPGLDPAQLGSLAIDFLDVTTETYVTTHLRFKFPEKLAPGTKAVGGVLNLTAGCNAQYGAGKNDNMFKPGDIFVYSCDQVPQMDGDKHPMNLPHFDPDAVLEVGGKVQGALEPGERVEWKIDETKLNKLLTDGNDLCLGIWVQWEGYNNIHYQGNDGPAPPRLGFTVQPL